jgi:hypothetical protein
MATRMTHAERTEYARRKATLAGFLDARPSAPGRGWVTLYDAEEQGIPASDGGKYAVVCEQHGYLLQGNNRRDMEATMRYPTWELCAECFPTTAEA